MFPSHFSGLFATLFLLRHWLQQTLAPVCCSGLTGRYLQKLSLWKNLVSFSIFYLLADFLHSSAMNQSW